MPDLTDINTQTIGMDPYGLDDAAFRIANNKNALWLNWLKAQPPEVRKKFEGPLDAVTRKKVGEFMDFLWEKEHHVDNDIRRMVEKANRNLEWNKQDALGRIQFQQEKADKEAFEQTEQNLWEAQAMKDKVRRKKEKMNFLKKGGELYPTVPPYSP